MAKKTFICDQCLTEFTPTFSPKKNASGKHFCGVECSNKNKLVGKTDTEKRRCERCGQELLEPSQKRYCSTSCANADKDEGEGYTYIDSAGKEQYVGVCLNCRNRPPYAERTGKMKRTFCNDKCYNEYMEKYTAPWAD